MPSGEPPRFRRSLSRTISSAALCILAPFGCADTPPEPAAASQAPPAAEGAALRYAEAVEPMLALTKVDIDLEISPDGFRIEPPYPNEFGEGTVPDKMRALADAGPAIDRLVEVAMMDECVWPVLGEAGDGNPREIHRGMRQAARILTIDALRLLSEGDRERAARRLGACLGLARHLAAGDTAIDSLVAAAIFSFAANRITMAADGFMGQRLDTPQLAVLFAELARFDATEPFGAGMSMERCIADDARTASDPGIPPANREMFSRVRARERSMATFDALTSRLGPPTAER